MRKSLLALVTLFVLFALALPGVAVAGPGLSVSGKMVVTEGEGGLTPGMVHIHEWSATTQRNGTVTGTFTLKSVLTLPDGTKYIQPKQSWPITSLTEVSPGTVRFEAPLAVGWSPWEPMTWGTDVWVAHDGGKTGDTLTRECYIHEDFHDVSGDSLTVRIR